VAQAPKSQKWRGKPANAERRIREALLLQAEANTVLKDHYVLTHKKDVEDPIAGVEFLHRDNGEPHWRAWLPGRRGRWLLFDDGSVIATSKRPDCSADCTWVVRKDPMGGATDSISDPTPYTLRAE
jgi:hypothetical protein